MPDVDFEARRLLEIIALRESEGNPMTVTDAMALTDIASPATLHRKLDSLLSAGLVEHHFEGINRRTKYLVPTAIAMNHFDMVGKALQKSIKPL